MNARMQISMAMQLSSELGRMTQSYNTRLAQLLRSHDVTYPQYAVLDHIMRNGTKAETISQISDAVEVLQPAVTKIARKFSKPWIAAGYRHRNRSSSKTRFYDSRGCRIHWEIAGFLDARCPRVFFRLARRKIRHLCRLKFESSTLGLRKIASDPTSSAK